MDKKMKSLPVLLLILAMLTALLVFPATAEENTTVTTANELAAAVAQGGTIVLGADIEVSETVDVTNDIVIDGQGQYTVTGTGRKTFAVNANAVFQNVTVVNTASAGRAIDTRVGNITLELNNVTLKTTGSGNTQALTVGGNGENITYKITGSTIEAGNSGYGIIVFNPVAMTIESSTVSGYGALYFKPANSSVGSAGSVVDVKNSTLSSHNIHSGESDNFGTVVFEDKNITVNVDAASKLSATSEGNASQHILNLNENTEIKVAVEPGAELAGELVSGVNTGSTVVLPEVAKNETTGETYYSLNEAIAAVNEGETVKLLTNVSGAGIKINENVTIDFGGYAYTVIDTVGSAGTVTNGVQILKDNDVTLVNGTVKAGSDKVKILIQNYANLIVKDVTLDGTGSANMRYVLSNNNGETAITGATSITAPKGAVAFDVYDYAAGGYTGVRVSVDTTGVITGSVEVSDGNAELVINAGTFTADVSDYVAQNAGVEESDGSYTVHVHDSDTLIPAVGATCTEDGTTAGAKCSVCGKVMTASETVKAAGHKLTKTDAKAATCTEGGNVEYHTCSVCKKTFDAQGKELTVLTTDALGHDLTKVEAKAASYTAAGNIEHHICQTCGKYYAADGKTEITKESVVIEQLSDNPNTGSLSVAPVIALLVINAIGAGAVVAGKKRFF